MTQLQPSSKATRQTVAANPAKRKRVAIIGAGFAGISATRALRHADVDICLIDRRNHFIFQPLLYQVATAVLSPSDIAAPVRELEAKQKNLTVMLAEVTTANLETRIVEAHCPGLGIRQIPFDFLVVAAGMEPSYYGHNEFARHAPGLKTLSQAEEIRSKILSAFELAEVADDPTERQRQMTFVLVGAGPTGVELAASLAQMARVTLRKNFRRLDPAASAIILLDGADRVLPTFAESLSKRVAKRLERLGVAIWTGVKVETVDDQGVVAGGKRIPSATVLWTAGVSASPITKLLGVETDRTGRILVDPFMNVPGASHIFVVGDASALPKAGRPVPGVAQAAIQQGRFVGKRIVRELKGQRPAREFRYFDRGNMAVVGKNFAVLEAGRIRMSGFIAWLIWAFVHVMSLPQPQNRLRVRTQWVWSYLTGQRSSRIISEMRPAPAENAPAERMLAS